MGPAGLGWGFGRRFGAAAAADSLPLRPLSQASLKVWTRQASTIMRANSLKHVFLAVLHTLLVLFLCRALTGTDVGTGPGGSGEGARARLLVQKLSLAAPQGAKALEETHVGLGLGAAPPTVSPLRGNPPHQPCRVPPK